MCIFINKKTKICIFYIITCNAYVMFNKILVHNLYKKIRTGVVGTLVLQNKLKTKNKRITMDGFIHSIHSLRFVYKIWSIVHTKKNNKVCKMLQKYSA